MEQMSYAAEIGCVVREDFASEWSRQEIGKGMTDVGIWRTGYEAERVFEKVSWSDSGCSCE